MKEIDRQTDRALMLFTFTNMRPHEIGQSCHKTIILNGIATLPGAAVVVRSSGGAVVVGVGVVECSSGGAAVVVGAAVLICPSGGAVVAVGTAVLYVRLVALL